MVVMMGESGVLVIENERTTHVPAPRVDTVETTGAGDAFWGSLAAGALEALPAAGEIKSLLAAASSAA